MPTTRIPFAVSSYSERINDVATAYLNNYYPHTPLTPAKSDKMLRGTQGIVKGPQVLTSEYTGVGRSSGGGLVYAGWVTCKDAVVVGDYAYFFYVAQEKTTNIGTTADTSFLRDVDVFDSAVDLIKVVKAEVTTGTVSLSNSFDASSFTDRFVPEGEVNEGDPRPTTYVDELKIGWEVAATFSNTAIALAPIGNMIGTAQNGRYVVALFEEECFVLDTTTDTLTRVTDADFTANGQPNGVAFIDGYFVFTTDAKKFIISALNDPLSYSALDFGSAEADPDGCVCPFVYRNQLYIAGTRTIEVFTNIGGVEFPFQRAGQFFEYGVLSPRQVLVHDSGVYFVGSSNDGDPAAYRLTDQVERITQSSRFEFLESVESLATDCFMGSHSVDGHEFVFFLMPRSPALVYDVREDAWHRRESELSYTGYSSAYRARGFASLNGYTLVGDLVDNEDDVVDGQYPVYVGILDSQGRCFSEYSSGVERYVITPPLHNELSPFSIASLEVAADSTLFVNLTDGFQLTPTRDGIASGAYTLGLDPPRAADGGVYVLGERFVFRRLGRANQEMTFKIQAYDPSIYAADNLKVVKAYDIVDVTVDISG